MTNCPNCGEAVSSEQNFCRNCGADLSDVGPVRDEKDGQITESSAPVSGVENGQLSCEPQGDYVTKKRFKKIEGVLDDDEKVHFITRGSTVDVEGSSAGNSLFGDDRSRKSGTRGWVRAVFTDRRVVVKVPQFLGTDERSVPYRSITSVDLDTGLVTKRLSLQTPGQTYHIEAHEPGKSECRDIVRFVREKIEEANTQGTSTSTEPDPTEQLKNIKDLHDEGVLTDAEFEEKKQSLLDKL